MFTALVLLALAAVGVLVQSGSSGAALFTAVLVNAAAAPLAHATRLERRPAPRPMASRRPYSGRRARVVERQTRWV